MTFIITTPIPYTNAEPHLGHLLEGVFNDTLARFYRRLNDGDVNLTMGVDQHGQKIYDTALEQGFEPEEFVDQTSKIFIKTWEEFNVLYDSWIPTHSREHQLVAQVIWKELDRRGFVYKKEYEGDYCVGCEEYKTESQLEDGDCPLHPGKKLKKMKEENYFLKLSTQQEAVLDWLKSAKIKPESVINEQVNFVTEGLRDISISREKSKLPWGIAVPEDGNQVMYVWFEALINYLTATVNLETVDRWYELESDKENIEAEILEEIRSSLPIEVMYASKEISKFHFVIFIGMMSMLDFDQPRVALAHGMVNDDKGIKFSKSLGNGVFPGELLDKFGVDGSRFLLLYEVNLFGDTKFSWNKFTESYNSHLADNVGNLLMRVTTLISKNFGDTSIQDYIDSSDIDESIDLQNKVYKKLQSFDVRGAIEVILSECRASNERLESSQPWKMIKNNQIEEAKKVLFELAISLKEAGQLLSIFMPEAGAKIYESITAEEIKKAKIIFPKIEL